VDCHKFSLPDQFFAPLLGSTFRYPFRLKHPIRGYWDFVLFGLMVVARQTGDVKHYLHQPSVRC